MISVQTLMMHLIFSWTNFLLDHVKPSILSMVMATVVSLSHCLLFAYDSICSSQTFLEILFVVIQVLVVMMEMVT